MLSAELIAKAQDYHPDIREAILETWDEVAKKGANHRRVVLLKSGTDDEPTPLLLKLRRMAKQVEKLQAQTDEAAKQIAKRNEESKPLTPEASKAFAKAFVAISEKLIETQISLMVRKTGETDVQLYNRCLSENPKLYATLDMAKQGASAGSYQCTFGSDPSATARIEKELRDAKLKPDALTGAAYAEYEAARMRRAA